MTISAILSTLRSVSKLQTEITVKEWYSISYSSEWNQQDV